ncbi:DUF4349 domain-containing protein [Hymenobacter volaticus]|uniref:DUF4349 domain-containing protein n=1 Tax=Hymenobacter volaticus TaxID=2932254 RepID=A0ABY4GAX1_9BACT|nr:DUF4349 domain-containing protein [Hymenobacter volaticus]UOQ68054.1 DUF4349 domain-containing protein [Hymenobacter volaticus]
MRKTVWIPLFCLLLLVSCNKEQEALSEDKLLKENVLMDVPPMMESKSEEVEAQAIVSDESFQEIPSQVKVTAAPAATRKLIYHAEVRVKVEDLDRANARMDSLTRTYGAYVSDAAETRQDGERQHQMKIRVIPGRFQAMLGSLNGLGTLVSKSLSTDDVTAEHADVSARLGTKRALEQRYVALLSQAKKISDILEIEEKIGQVRGDIEATESRLKTLNDQVAYSTITLTYFQPIALTAPDAPVISFGSRLVQSFYDGWELLTGLVLALVTAWPLLLGGALGVWGLRAWRHRRRQRAAASA